MKVTRLAVALLALAPALPTSAQQLQMVDVGYMVGPGFWNYGQGYRLNDRDQVIGHGSAEEVRCFFWDRWAMTDLGTLGGIRCTVRDVNNGGEVVGASYIPPADPAQPYMGPSHGFVWKASTGMVDLGVAYGGPVTFAADPAAINEAGQIVGYGATGNGSWAGLLWLSGAATGPVPVSLWQSWAVDINASGQVIGNFNTSSTTTAAYLYENGAITYLDGLPGSQWTHARAINDVGQVIGATSTMPTDSWGYLWQRDPATGQGTYTDLGALGVPADGSGQLTAPYALSPDGRVVGSGKTVNGDYHAFLWEPGTGMRDLGTLGGSYSSAADVAVVNGVVKVIGQSTTAADEYHAFLWQNGTMYDLGTLGGSDSAAWDINASGHIVGESTTAGNAERHAVLWTTRPTPVLLDDLGALAKAFVLAKDYTSKLTSAAGNLAAGKTTSACNDLGSFTSSVSAQSGKAVPAIQAHQLLLGSRNISRLLGCK